MCLRQSPTRLDSNWPAQLQKLAWGLKFWLQKLETLHYLGSEQQRRWSDCADAQADLRLCCSHMTCDINHLYSLSFPYPMKAPHKIWLQLAKRFLRKRSLKLLKLSDRRRRFMNNLDLWYSYRFMYIFSLLHLPTLISKTTIVSEKSIVFTFVLYKSLRDQIWPCVK